MFKDEEPFNSDYIEADRILDESHSVDKENGEVRNFWTQIKNTFVYEIMYTCIVKLLFCCSVIAIGVLLGEVVLSALWGCHMGAERRCRWREGGGV